MSKRRYRLHRLQRFLGRVESALTVLRGEQVAVRWADLSDLLDAQAATRSTPTVQARASVEWETE